MIAPNAIPASTSSEMYTGANFTVEKDGDEEEFLKLGSSNL